VTKISEEVKAKLLVEAEKAIDEMLSHRAFDEAMTLSEMEQVVGEVEAEISQALMQGLVNGNWKQKSDGCPDCGGKLRNKGKRRKPLVTVRGEIEVERDYYVCTECGRGYFPPG